MLTNKKLAFVCLAILAMLVSACASTADSPQDSNSQESEFPTGSYYDPFGFVLTFQEDGTFFASDPDGEVVVRGTYTVEGDQVTIVDDFCETNPGVYRWISNEDDPLKMFGIRDGCGQRIATMANSLEPVP